MDECRKIGHDFGNGPGGMKILQEGERQVCAQCGSSREMVKGKVKYNYGRVTIQEEKDNG